MPFHLFVSFKISFSNVLYFPVYKSITSLIKSLPKYFTLFFFNVEDFFYYSVNFITFIVVQWSNDHHNQFFLTYLSEFFFFLFFLLFIFLKLLHGIVFLTFFLGGYIVAYRNIAEFCVLIFYPAALVKSSIISKRFFMESLGFYTYEIMLFAKIILLLLFQFGWHAFFICLIVLVE